MVNEKNDTVSVEVEDHASDKPDNAASSVPQTEQETKTAGTKSRSKPRVSRKKKLSPETASSDNGDARADIPASETAELSAAAPLSQPEATCDGVAVTSQNTAEPEQNKESQTKRPRKTASRSARTSRTSASDKRRKKNDAPEQPDTPDHADALSNEHGIAAKQSGMAELSIPETASPLSPVAADSIDALRDASNPAISKKDDGPETPASRQTPPDPESADKRAGAARELETPEAAPTLTAQILSKEFMADAAGPDSAPLSKNNSAPKNTAYAEATRNEPEDVQAVQADMPPEPSAVVADEPQSVASNAGFLQTMPEDDIPEPRLTDDADSMAAGASPSDADAESARQTPAGGVDAALLENMTPGAANKPTNLDPEDASPKPQKKARRKMFISVQAGEQAEVVLTEDGVIEEYYVEMQHQIKTKGNIYKGTIHNIDANLQAAFVSYGAEKNGFLQIDEVHPEYYLVPHEPAKGKKYPLMQKVLRPGQEVLVQVVKEPTGSKGAFLTTYLSLPGRFLVLTPGSEQIGVSRKVENSEERERLRSLLEGLEPGPGLGVIVRTVSSGASKAALLRDFQYLTRLWQDIRSRGTVTPPPCLLHREPDLAARAVRDYLTEDVNEIWVDDEDTAASIREVISLLFPRRPGLVKTHRDQMQTLWERFSLLKQLEQIYAREVFLPSGGRLVFDQTEALTAIDINSGKTSGKNNFEAMALRTNQEAAEAIARQLRLRDLGGQVVIDFIEMRDRNHWREVEKTMRNAMKVDRARYDVGKISNFGLMELVRQRLGSSALSITMESCPLCRGTGLRRNMEWQSQQALREIKRRLRSNQSSPLICEFDMELALYLLNNKRSRILELEQEFDQRVEIHPRH